MPDTRHEQLTDTTKRTARFAGVVYLALGIATGVGFYHAPLVHSDLSAITHAMAASDLRFQIGVTADVVAATLGIPLAILLYQLLERINKAQAVLMASLLAVSVPISFVVALDYVGAHMLLSGSELASAFTGAQRQALAMFFLRLHADGVLAEEIFWGLWLLPFGLLVIRSRFLPRVLGILLVIASVAYVAHSLVTMLLGGARFDAFEHAMLLIRAAGELPIILWLVIRGADVRPPRQKSAVTPSDAT